MALLRTVLASAFGSVLLAGAATGETYSLSTILEPGHLITRHLHVEWADAVRQESGGEIDFEVFTGGSLLPALGTLQGVADGVAQAAIIAPAYTPSNFSVSNATGDLGFVRPDSMLLAFANGDFAMHEKVSIEDWTKNGVLFGAPQATPIYNYLCNDELNTLADLRGKRVRTPGGGWARFSTDIGMVPVNIPSSEIYMALERGQVDCVCADPTHLTTGSQIMDLVKSVLMVPITPAYTNAGIAYDLDFWRGLPTDQRRLLLDKSARALVRLQMAYDREVVTALEAAKKRGIVLVEPDPTLRKAYDDWVAAGIGNTAGIAKESYGIEDPQTLFDLYQTYISKWQKLLEGVDRTDEEALTALVKANLFDTVDASTYGME